jgi:hypothetical protein
LVVAAMGGVLLAGMPVCPMAAVLHIPCPGCGMTRATIAALHGHFAESFRMHPLAMIFTPMLGLYFAAHAVSYIRHGASRVDELLMGKWVHCALIVLMLVMLGVWIARFFGAFGGPAPV